MAEVTVSADRARGVYVVRVGLRHLGTVTKKVTRYNLQRPVTSVEWVPHTPDGAKVDGYFRRRKDAVAALVEP